MVETNFCKLKPEGAGFTVYRISKLSKAAQFKQNPDGRYDAASILSAYRKDNYDNATLKYDFTHEGQAIANMFESSTDTVNAYNATLTADGDYANGRGNGWMPTDQPAEYRLEEMFTNDEGVFRVEGLPYGQYLVVETTIPKDVFQCDPFIVAVDANSPQSRFTVPAGSVTTPSSDYMTFNVLDEELEGYLQLIKTDTETGKAVKIANTAFALYRLDEKDRKTRISMIDPASGNATKKTDVFYTDANGLMKTPEKLPLGRYLIEELQGPEGYFYDSAYSVEFEIKSDRVWQVVGNATNDMDEYIVTEKYCNHETLGQLTIRKLGNVLTDYKDNQFIYTQDNLAGAVYEIHAVRTFLVAVLLVADNGFCQHNVIFLVVPAEFHSVALLGQYKTIWRLNLGNGVLAQRQGHGDFAFGAIMGNFQEIVGRLGAGGAEFYFIHLTLRAGGNSCHQIAGFVPVSALTVWCGNVGCSVNFVHCRWADT